MKDSSKNFRKLKEVALDLIKSALKKQKAAKVRFLGVSMTPAIRNGDMIILKEESPNSIKVGEVIVFDRENDLIGHRVIWKVHLDRLYFLTRGDNTAFYDLPVPAEAIYGKAILSKFKKNVIPKISLKMKLFFLTSIILLNLENKISNHKPIQSIIKKVGSRIYQNAKGESSV